MELTSLLATALEATDMASAIVRGRLPGDLTAKGDRDLTSEVDFAVEHAVREFLGTRTPSLGILGEEEGMTFGQSDEHMWVLDPIDGTVNFVRGIPLCGVSLALVHRDQPVLGVIDLPFLNVRYSATLGTGAYRNGQRIYASKTSTLSEAMVVVGDYAVGENANTRNQVRLAVTHDLAEVALRIRMLGSAAMDLAWLAEGLIDASVTLSNNPWDMAAGVVLAREAGAVVKDRDGSDYSLRSSATLAAAPDLIDEFLGLISHAESRSVPS